MVAGSQIAASHISRMCSLLALAEEEVGRVIIFDLWIPDAQYARTWLSVFELNIAQAYRFHFAIAEQSILAAVSGGKLLGGCASPAQPASASF